MATALRRLCRPSVTRPESAAKWSYTSLARSFTAFIRIPPPRTMSQGLNPRFPLVHPPDRGIIVGEMARIPADVRKTLMVDGGAVVKGFIASAQLQAIDAELAPWLDQIAW